MTGVARSVFFRHLFGISLFHSSEGFNSSDTIFASSQQRDNTSAVDSTWGAFYVGDTIVLPLKLAALAA
jgi:hypothetical protein